MHSFLSDEPMKGDAPYQWVNFMRPKLRRFPSESLASLKWKSKVGYGIDGVVLKAKLGDGSLVAVKIFNSPERPEPINGCPRYWAFKRECQNSALLDMIKTSLKQAALNDRHIYLHPCPRTYKEALRNLKAFSAEAALEPTPPPNFKPADFDARPNDCLGWTEFSAQEVRTLLQRLKADAPDMEPDRSSYFAIVYSFVPEGTLDDAVIQAQYDFFYLVGFTFAQFKEDNWRGSGILVDFSDLTSPLTTWWDRLVYGKWIKRVMRTGLARWTVETPNRPP
ncbi:hypothetical protein B0T17DRAFT_506453 [Bombardia bombarda]|uniref:Uncharacterized protein n=1 Tax=Bombardia bombarda TaxID=252184 RepID=A0AA39X9Q9_9PEZI|nr:hypothetical protein B0T17DRAFT_506453 [Bombardia bombarda]